MAKTRTSFKTGQTELQLAYLAGIIDGEGCFYIGNITQGKYGTGRQWHSFVSVTNCDEALIIWIEQLFGGWKNNHYRWTSKKAFYRPVFTWKASGAILDYLLPKIEPYLVLKKKHCDVMMRYRKTSKNIGSRRLPPEVFETRKKLLLEIRNLNSRYHNHPLKNPSPLSP